MSDDLDAALAATRKPKAQPVQRPLTSSVAAILPLAESFKAAVAGASTGSFAIDTVEGRHNLAVLSRTMSDVISLATARKKAIDYLFATHFSEAGSRKLFIDPTAGKDSATITYEPPRNDYVVDDPEALRKALHDFADESVTEDELAEAVVVEIVYKPNHVQLNELSRRDARMKAVIDAYRRVKPADPLAGHVKFPRDL